jgi:hypothetical protein
LLYSQHISGGLEGKIIPLLKISNPSDFSDNRSITILPCLSMAFEVCILGQIVEDLILNKLLDSLQSGFKANHSTTTALLKDLNKAAVALF